MESVNSDKESKISGSSRKRLSKVSKMHIKKSSEQLELIPYHLRDRIAHRIIDRQE